MPVTLVIILAVLFVFVSLLMMLVILIQRPKGGGLAGAFGGAGGSADAAFGAKTGDVLTYATVGFFVVFLVVAVGLQWTIKPRTSTPATPPATTTSAPAMGTGEPEEVTVELPPMETEVFDPGVDPSDAPLEVPTPEASEAIDAEAPATE
ncbi:MAG: preprotein translocase subunit SecG [Planctomycetota bacterium]